MIALLLSLSSFTQSNIVTVGFQYKPIIPSGFFGAGEFKGSEEFLDFTVTPTLGYNYGMVIRRGITDRLSLESGISYIRRNYELEIIDNDSNFTSKSDFGMVGYEIPVQGLLYVRLGENMYMNNAFGMSFDFYASDIETFPEYFRNNTFRHDWFRLALTANVGFEYRTEKSGFFYLGGSFHQPLQDIATSLVRAYKGVGAPVGATTDLTGTYLTIDLRYFFHEDPEKRTGKKKKKEKKDRAGGVDKS